VTNEKVEPIYQAIGARIAMIRETLGLSQLDLSRKVGLTRVSVSNIEVGKHRILLHTVVAFAEALGTTPKNLLRGIWL
jgi:transcriptional regulator with XRE-family HTH domain